jgi:TPR repeat protein
MAAFRRNDLEESFARFERAAAKGHEESIWIMSVVKDVEMENSAVRKAFGKTEEPLGWYFAGLLSDGREKFDFYKKSAEGGCSWGQVQYGWRFRTGKFVEKDMKLYVEWLEKAASNQNNPEAMEWLGWWFLYDGDDKEKALSYFRAAAELGWERSMNSLAEMLKDGEGCVKDSRQAVIWSTKGDSNVFWDLLGNAGQALKSGAREDLDCDFDQLCYSLGWGLFWYQYETGRRKNQNAEAQTFGNRCLDFYCSCVELQQESIFTFLWFWNRTTGVRGPGQMIAQMVWEGREDNLVKTFEQNGEKEPETKRIKK